MGKKSETAFKDRIAPLLKALPNTWVCKVQQVALRGDPDFILCINGAFVALELKKDGQTEPEPLQRHRLAGIVQAQGIAFVVFPENWKEIYSYLKGLAEVDL